MPNVATTPIPPGPVGTPALAGKSISDSTVDDNGNQLVSVTQPPNTSIAVSGDMMRLVLIELQRMTDLMRLVLQSLNGDADAASLEDVDALRPPTNS